MSNPYGPAIETTEDWNATLACCCAMPEPPAPTMLCESISLDYSCAFQMPSHPAVTAPDLYKRFLTRVMTFSSLFTQTGESWPGYQTDYEDLESWSVTCRIDVTPAGCSTVLVSSVRDDFTRNVEEYPPAIADNRRDKNSSASEGVACSGTEVYVDKLDHANDSSEPWVGCVGCDSEFSGTLIYNSFTRAGLAFTYHYVFTDDPEIPNPTSRTDDQSLTFSNEVTAATVTAALAPLAFPADQNGTSCTALMWTAADNITVLGGRKSRYRWRVPSTHLGSYYKVTWDVLYEPVGWDATIPDPEYTGSGTPPQIPKPGRPLRYSRKDLTVEWEGPGSGAQSDPSWLAGDWQTLEVPDEPGVRKVINVRFEHLRKETP